MTPLSSVGLYVVVPSHQLVRATPRLTEAMLSQFFGACSGDEKRMTEAYPSRAAHAKAGPAHYLGFRSDGSESAL